MAVAGEGHTSAATAGRRVRNAGRPSAHCDSKATVGTAATSFEESAKARL